MDYLQLAVLASGRGSNFSAIASACARPEFPARVACLISDNPNAGALDIARNHKIPTHIVSPGTKRGRLAPGAEAEIVEICRDANVELVCLAGFMRIVRDELLLHYAGRIINIHPSLLPAFPGLNGPGQAFEYGVKIAGATVHFVDDTVDGGAIIRQASVPVLDEDTAATLAERILAEEHRIFADAIELIATQRVKVDGRRVTIVAAPPPEDS